MTPLVFVFPCRPESSGVLHGHPVQLGHLQGDQVHGARAHRSLPPHALLCWLGRQAALDPSHLPALVCRRLCSAGASSLTQRSNKLKVSVVIYTSGTFSQLSKVGKKGLRFFFFFLQNRKFINSCFSSSSSNNLNRTGTLCIIRGCHFISPHQDSKSIILSEFIHFASEPHLLVSCYH